jgi:3',5'-cyclic AMP phosphodiesterase CpdA
MKIRFLIIGLLILLAFISKNNPSLLVVKAEDDNPNSITLDGYLQDEDMKRISIASDGLELSGDFANPLISDDGRYTLFERIHFGYYVSVGLNDPEVFIYDNNNHTTEAINVIDGSFYKNLSSLPSLPYMNGTEIITDRIVYKNYYGKYVVMDYKDDVSRNCNAASFSDYNLYYNSDYLSLITADYNSETSSFFDDPHPLRIDFCLSNTDAQVFYVYNGLKYSRISRMHFPVNGLVIESSSMDNIVYNTQPLQWNMNYPKQGYKYPILWPDGSLGLRSTDVSDGDVIKEAKNDFFISSTYQVNGIDFNDFADSLNHRYFTFVSDASDLVSNDTNGLPDIFVRDNLNGAVRRLNVSISGIESNGYSYNPVISADGRYIAFDSFGSTFFPSDLNNKRDIFLVKNLLYSENISNNSPASPVKLRQYEVGGDEDLVVGGSASSQSVILEAEISDPDGDMVNLRYDVRCLEDSSIYLSGVTGVYPSGSIAQINLNDLGGCSYVWKIKTVDDHAGESEWVEFGGNSSDAVDFAIKEDFSFVHITDVHIGSNKAFLAQRTRNDWYESQSYPRFTDVLYEIETEVSPRPDFVLVGGDDVEYNNITWLRDFKAITDDFSKRTGIEVFVVPGNHDRYDSESSGISLGELNLSGGNDNLRNYFEVMKDNQNVTSFFVDNSDIMDDAESKDRGLNKYNYYFYHKGVQFIGLDSGEDTGVWDLTPESSGLNDYTMFLKLTLQNSSDVPKVIFFHNPVYNDKGLSSERDENSDMNEFVPSESFVHNHRNFINYCNDNNVQLVLSGHTHQNKVFNENGGSVDLSSWNGDYPLYIQTQSATKDSNNNMHGYRVIDVIGGKAIPHEPMAGVTKYAKIISDLDTNNNLTVAVYDRSGQRVTIQNPGKTVPFFATTSGRTIMYEDTGMSRFTIGNYNNSYGEYDFLLQKRDEGAEPQGDKWSFSGVKIKNPELCKENPNCASFLAMRKEDGQKVNTLDFWGMDIDKQVEHAIEVNWTELQNSSLTQQIDGLKFVVNNNYNTTYEKMPWVHVIDLNSPGELRVYGADGKVTGLVDGEMKSEIPYSFYVPETETVFLFGDVEQDITEGIKTQVVGSYSATYDLSFSLQENDEEEAKVFADDIPTDSKTTHQFSVDWQTLSEGGKGVNMQFDEDDDGQFEKSFNYSSLVTANLLIADAGSDYTGIEGSEVLFDGSSSSSSGSSIVIYEWDFDNNGIYDLSSILPTVSHIYGDDYVGKIFLRVTDNLGVTSVDSADITIKNVNPLAEIKKIESSSLSEGFSFDVSFNDPGWLDIHTASVDWGDGSIQNISIDENNLSPETYGKTSISHKYRPIKDYTIKLTVIDDDGGAVSAKFIIQSPKQLKIESLAKLKSIKTENKLIRKELDKAIKNLENSLNKKYWDDDFHLNSKYGYKMFNEEKQAMQSLIKILKVKELPADSDIKKDVRVVMAQLVQSDILLLQVIISEKDIKVKNPIFQKIIDSGLNVFKSKIEKFVQNTDYYNSEQVFDGFNGLWGSGRALDFSRFVR